MFSNERNSTNELVNSSICVFHEKEWNVERKLRKIKNNAVLSQRSSTVTRSGIGFDRRRGSRNSRKFRIRVLIKYILSGDVRWNCKIRSSQIQDSIITKIPERRKWKKWKINDKFHRSTQQVDIFETLTFLRRSNELVAPFPRRTLPIDTTARETERREKIGKELRSDRFDRIICQRLISLGFEGRDAQKIREKLPSKLFLDTIGSLTFKDREYLIQESRGY